MVTEKQVVVSIERNNKVYINDQALYLDQIPNYLDKINKDNVVVVKADKEIDHGFVVQIMDLIKRSGFKKYQWYDNSNARVIGQRKHFNVK